MCEFSGMVLIQTWGTVLPLNPQRLWLCSGFTTQAHVSRTRAAVPHFLAFPSALPSSDPGLGVTLVQPQPLSHPVWPHPSAGVGLTSIIARTSLLHVSSYFGKSTLGGSHACQGEGLKMVLGIFPVPNVCVCVWTCRFSHRIQV